MIAWKWGEHDCMEMGRARLHGNGASTIAWEINDCENAFLQNNKISNGSEKSV